MAYLGIDPSPQVGEIMDLLLEKRIEEGPYSRRIAFETARAWVISKGGPDPGPASEDEEE